MKQQEILRSLEQLNLSRSEARVYLELLKLGGAHAGPVVKNTGLHRQIVYNAFDRLSELKLVSMMQRSNRKFFQAAPPTEVLRVQQQREQVARDLVPHLEALLPSGEYQVGVQVLRGRQEFYRNAITVLEAAARADKIVRIIGGATDEDFYRALGERYEDYRREGQRLGVRKFLIAPETVSLKFREIFAQEPGNVLKVQRYGLSSPTYTRITPELTTIELYVSEIIVIQIWNRVVGRGYREHFELLWSRARTYTPQV